MADSNGLCGVSSYENVKKNQGAKAPGGMHFEKIVCNEGLKAVFGCLFRGETALFEELIKLISVFID